MTPVCLEYVPGALQPRLPPPRTGFPQKCQRSHSKLSKRARILAAREKELELNDEKAKISTFKAVEKRKRFKLERDISDRLQKEVVLLLESGRTLVPTSQLGVELQARDNILCTMKEEAASAKLEAEFFKGENIKLGDEKERMSTFKSAEKRMQALQA
jgi:hypothetical protein